MKVKKSSIRSKEICSDDDKRRYSLIRVWDEFGPRAAVIMFNPAVASHIKLDKSSSLCMNKVIDQGYGSLEIVNLFSIRSRSKDELLTGDREFEEKNFKYIKKAVESASYVIVGWGADGEAVTEHLSFKKLLSKHSEKLYCFGTSKNSNIPAHPRNFGEESLLNKYHISQ